jgi:hypothetical protein
MPFDVEDDQQKEQPDLIAQALRASMGPVRTAPAMDAAPPPPSVAPQLSDDNLMRRAMSSGVSTIPNSAPNAPAVSGGPSPSTIAPVLDKSTAMPPAPTNLRLGDLIQQRAHAGQPIDRNDPKYKMGTGMKVLGTVGNFLSGFGGSKREPTYVGSGATNARYARDESQQKKTLANLDTEIGSTEKLNTENESLFRDATRQAYDAQMGQAREDTAQARKGTAAAQLETAKVRQQAEADKASQREITYDPKTKRFQQGGKTYVPKTIEEGASLEAANGIKGRYSEMWGAERKNQSTPARQPTDLELWRDAFKRDNGREPNAQEIADRKYHPKSAASNSGRVSGAQKDKETELAQAEQQFKKDWNQAYKDGDTDEATLNEIKARHEQNKARIQKAFDDRMTTLDPDGSLQQGGGAAPSKPAVQPTPAAQPSPSAAKPQGAPQRKVNDIVPTKKGMMKITKILPNGQYEGVPAGQ